MGCSSPDTPAAPDYVGAAQAQGQANWQTALANAFASNPNVNTPYGSQRVSWNQLPSVGGQPAAAAPAAPQAPATAPASTPGWSTSDYGPYTGGGADSTASTSAAAATTTPATTSPEYERWQATIDQTLSPEQQALYEQGTRINQGLGDIAESGISRVGETLGTPYDASGLPSRVTSVQGGPLQSSVAQPRDFRYENPATSTAAGALQYQNPGAASAIGALQFQNPGAATATGALQYQNPTANAAINTLKPAADLSTAPAMPTADQATRQSVINALYGQATSRLDPQWQQGESTARNRLLQQGFTEGSTGFDQAMGNFGRAKNDAYSTALNSSIAAGGDALAQQFGLGLQARQQGTGEQFGQANLSNAAAGQMANIGLENTQLTNQAANSLANIEQNSAALGNQAANSLASIGQNSAALTNQAAQSLYGMGAGDQANYNAANSAQFGQNLQNAQFGNTAQGQAFTQGLAGADFTNAQRGTQLSEELALRQLPLNELNSLRTGTQVQNPSFPGFSGVNSQAGDIAGAAGQQGQWDTGVYNAQAGQSGQNMSTLGSLGAAGIGALGTMGSTASGAAALSSCG